MTWPRSSRPSNPGHVSFPTATSSLHCTPLPLSSRKSRYMSIGGMFESMLYLNKSQNTASVYTEGVKLPELDLRCYYFKRFSARPFYKINSHYSSLTIFKYILVFWNFKALRACENRWLGPTSRVPYPVGLWGGQEPAFLTHSQVMVMLLTQRPHLENDCLRVYLKELG